MNMELAVLFVNPEAISAGDRDIGGSIDDDKIVRFDAGNHPPDMNMGVALRTDLVAIVRDSPTVAPQFFRFPDRRRPEFGPLLQRKIPEAMRLVRMNPRERQ